MANGDPLYHLSKSIEGLSADMREMRGEMGSLRDELAETRISVARMQGLSDGHTEVQVNVDSRRHRTRSFLVEAASALGVILGAGAAVIALIHP